MVKPVAKKWYDANLIDNGLWHIREMHIDPYSTGDIWMVCGAERNLVIDTGPGIVPLPPFIATLSDKSVIAVASCYYYDHAGGLAAFEHRTCHRLECDLIRNVPKPDTFDGIEDTSFTALPYTGFSAAHYRQTGCEATRLLEDGDIIELGDRGLEVIHIPGRTPGSIALFERDTGYLFGGETGFVDPEKRDFPPEQNTLYEQSLERLINLPTTKIFGGHYGAFQPDRLTKLARDETGRYRE